MARILVIDDQPHIRDIWEPDQTVNPLRRYKPAVPYLGDRPMILRLGSTTVVGETAVEGQLLEKRVRAGRSGQGFGGWRGRSNFRSMAFKRSRSRSIVFRRSSRRSRSAVLPRKAFNTARHAFASGVYALVGCSRRSRSSCAAARRYSRLPFALSTRARADSYRA